MRRVTHFVSPMITWLMMSGCAAFAQGPTSRPAQTVQTFKKEVTKAFEYKYLLYLPKEYGTPDKKWPLVLFLHGAGERGTHIEAVKRHGPPKLIAAGREFPFIVASPQCPAKRWWDPAALDALIDEIVAKYAVDESRIYLTGLSMGGYGTWNLACHHPERFAAIAPICGGGIPYLAREQLAKTPTWVFHGAKDPVVAPSESTRMVDMLKQTNPNVKLTMYPNADHDSWTRTYDSPEFYSWLLSHKR
ncbi:MAG TPA: prolyl oligopeptidase family serine peptidase [Phycisphaerae bacterium]|nr:prolyl oligopeptidase family serine peptidase [Phycisphaerae bacterium]HRY71059.1 prolyl oligopeptidase family serine peptidase [Phycisphaerae bacterium]HSA29149.1 prolyl oligopeptidase family serine peptidase [Phycisphaerae bacterium]